MLRGGAGDVDVGLDVGDPLAGRDPHHRRRRSLAPERVYLGFCCSGVAWIGRALPPWPLERLSAGAREAEEVWRSEGRRQRQRQAAGGRRRQAATEGRAPGASEAEPACFPGFSLFVFFFTQGFGMTRAYNQRTNLHSNPRRITFLPLRCRKVGILEFRRIGNPMFLRLWPRLILFYLDKIILVIFYN